MHIFFDLDGTLTDSSPGIIRCINHAVVELGYTEFPAERLQPLIGAPLARIFAAVLSTEDVSVLDRAVAAYRVRFNEVGIFENALYEGVAEALDRLCRAGHLLQVVTAKPAAAARRVVQHFGIEQRFVAVRGPELSARACDKADLVRAALHLADSSAHESVMVGDRAADIHAAHQHGVPAVAALWGYGSHAELMAAAPAFAAHHIGDVVNWVERVA